MHKLQFIHFPNIGLMTFDVIAIVCLWAEKLKKQQGGA
jgi:hypothetical protein